MRIRLSGNHSRVHAGCRAVWSVLHDMVRAEGHEIVPDGTRYDMLVMNGEGSMHHGAPTFVRKMTALSEALATGHRAALVNSVWQDNPSDWDDTLRALEFITVRELASQRDLALRHGIQARVMPDLSLNADVDNPDMEIVNFRGAVVATDFWSHEFGHFVRPSGGPLSRFAFLDLNRGNWATAIQSLRTASALVTGRQHAVYAACRARVPFVALAGNTHKIEAFLETAGVSIPVCRHPSALLEGLQRLGEQTAQFERLFDWCAMHRPDLRELRGRGS